MRVEYSSNNSGGGWWLKDKDWLAMKEAGWVLHDYKYKKEEWEKREKKDSLFNPLKFWDKSERYMGALCTEAHIEIESVADAIRSFEKATGQDAMDEGCNCCGAPHSFRWGRAIDDSLPKDAEYGYVSGEGCAEFLFPGKRPKTLRETLEEKTDA